MEWFKHSTGSHEDPDISDAWDQFGDAGPVIFWTILEVFGAEYSHLKDGWLTLSVPYFERKMRRKLIKTDKILEFFEKRERIFFKITPQTVSFTIPKFIKIASNWTTRPKQQPTEAPMEVPTEAPTAKEEKKNKNNTPLTPQIKKAKNTDIPSWVPLDMFHRYQESRSRKLKPASYEDFFEKLERLAKASGATPAAILKQSIENGWSGIFELKMGGNGRGHQQPTRLPRPSDVPDPDLEWEETCRRRELEART